MFNAGFVRGGWEVAKQGLRYAHKDDAAAAITSQPVLLCHGAHH
jgi:hypothetical protein